jgi:hypothetical protein
VLRTGADWMSALLSPPGTDLMQLCLNL